jgi:two-component system sensor histidine kinase TctE
VAAEVAAQLAVLAEERGVGIDVRIGADLPVVADPLMIRQAIMNVVDNAIKFSPEGGQVRIRASSTAREHALIVDDDGPGIPPDERERVFERFYRVEGGSAHHREGTGLGLAIVAWAIEAHHGRLVIGENEQGGARVVLALPRNPHSEPPHSRRAKAPPAYLT